MNLADHIKQELAAGREVRVHADKWLAHRDEGWMVGKFDSNQLLFVYPSESRPAVAYVPIAACTLVEPALKVGDRVRASVRMGSSPLTIIAMRGGWVWAVAEPTDAQPTTYHITDLERLP